MMRKIEIVSRFSLPWKIVSSALETYSTSKEFLHTPYFWFSIATRRLISPISC